MNKEQKQEVIETLKSKFSQYSNFYITDTENLSVAQVTNLRRHCFDKQVEMKVAKNTLIKKALESLDNEKYSGVYDSLHQVTALMFSESPKDPAVIISSFRKAQNGERPLLKAAFLNGDIFVGDNQLINLTKIKTKNELIGEVIGLLMSPIQRVIGALQNRPDTLPETKTEAPKAEATPETKAETPKAEAAPETKAEAPKVEAAPETKAEAPKVEATLETKVETPKAEAAPETKAETPKAEATPETKAETPKAAAASKPKVETSKAEAAPEKKAETPKAEAAPETETPKGETAKTSESAGTEVKRDEEKSGVSSPEEASKSEDKKPGTEESKPEAEA